MIRQKWEYNRSVQPNTFGMPHNPGNLIDYLNRRGQDGWEVVTIIENRCIDNPSQICMFWVYFKRRIK